MRRRKYHTIITRHLGFPACVLSFKFNHVVSNDVWQKYAKKGIYNLFSPHSCHEFKNRWIGVEPIKWGVCGSTLK